MICMLRRIAQLRASEPEDIDAVEANLPGRWLDQSENRASDGSLAATGFADQAERVAFPDGERYSVDRLHPSHRSLQNAAADREVFHQVLDHDQISVIGAARPASVLCVAGYHGCGWAWADPLLANGA
jgi:hypothetical protein